MNKKYLNEIIATTDKEFTDEELIHQLLDEKVSSRPAGGDRTTFGQRAADAVARFAGSWGFIFSFLLCMAVWMLINILMAANAFDAYPFILLNLVLSCIAAVQAPLIMMSQNRQEAKDRLRAENDYRVNLKNEIVINDLHHKLDSLIETQKRMEKELLELKQASKSDRPQ